MRLILPLLAVPLLGAVPALAEVTVTDSTGVTIALPAPAERVVTIDNAAYMAVTHLGVLPVGAAVGDAARADDANHPDGESVPNVGTDPWTPDGELVAAARPDLVVGWVDEHRPLLEAIAPYYAFAGLSGLDTYLEAFRDLGLLLGREARAEEIIGAFEARAAAYAARVPSRPRVMPLWVDADAGSFWISHDAYPDCQVLALVVACPWQNPAGDNSSFQAGIETVVALDPDVILLGVWPFEETEARLAQLAEDPLWGELRAVREGRVLTAATATAWSADSVAGFSSLLDNTMPHLFPATFPAPLTDAEVAAALRE